MDEQVVNNQTEAAAETSGRRDFIKKMVIAGAFAAPVVATFARGVRGTKSLQTALDENAPMNSLNAQRLNSRSEAHFQNASASRPPLTTSNTTIAKSPTTTNAPATTNAPTTTGGPTTTNAPATTGGPTTTNAPATTGGPTTTNAPATTNSPSTTAKVCTTVAGNTTNPPRR